MLIFISDLHFIDGTAGNHNINPKAFDYFFKDLLGIISDKKEAINEVKLVFLGDIFDLLRTTNWFGYPVAERPWGKIDVEKNLQALKVHAETIFDAVTETPANRKSLRKIKDYFVKIQEKCLQFEALYIPGNHDRLVNRWPSLRKKVCDSLGLSHDPDAEFPHFRQFPEYGVFARHGHEFDAYNYEGTGAFNRGDYQQVPIGDPITTELLSRLPYELKNRLDSFSLPAAEKERIIKNFQEIDNVRPLGAVIEWLLYQVKDQPAFLVNLVEDTVDAVIRYFNGLEFVQNWYQRHDKWLDPFDKADQAQIALYILEKFKVFSLEKLFSLASKAMDLQLSDPLLAAAPEERALRDAPFRYVVYGHTHDPLTVPIRIRGDREQIYLNTGTWRSRYQKAVRDNSFISWKNMTYVIFYNQDERPGREADFETWTGTLKMAQASG
jgi:UDP-2,3-diacylglucosamine pyrophosphatase LpxH